MHLASFDIVKFLAQYVVRWDEIIYVIILIALIFEGESILFGSYFFVNQGYLNLGLVTLIAIIATISGDVLWYFLGARLQKISIFKKWIERMSGIIDKQILKNPIRAIFVSKFAYGTHRITLIRSGSLKLPFKTYIKYASLASLAWLIVVGSLGYAASSLEGSIFPHYLKYAEIGLLAGLIVLLVVSRLLTIIFHTSYFD
jgi:membrane protein DedA with SNARE-associated domain